MVDNINRVAENFLLFQPYIVKVIAFAVFKFLPLSLATTKDS